LRKNLYNIYIKINMKFTKMLMCASLLFIGLILVWCISKHAKTIVEQYGGGGRGGGGRGGGGRGGGGRSGGGGGGGVRGGGGGGRRLGGGHRRGGHGLGGYGRGLGAAGLGYGLGRYYGGYGGGDGGSYGYLNNYYPYPVYVYDDDEVYSNYPYYSVI
jgi:hypothetical protein